ncbi:endolysin [Vibrio phage D518]
MSSFKFSQKSLNKLSLCDERLQRVAIRALELSKYDFGIGETLRTEERQAALVAEGKSWTMNSRHLPNAKGVSEALDILVYVNGKLTWEAKYFRKVIQTFITAATEQGVQLEFGGLWESVEDWPHVQLK